MNLNAKEQIDQAIQTQITSSGHHSMADMEIRNASWVNKLPILEENKILSVSMERN
jgi:hypothetical protein